MHVCETGPSGDDRSDSIELSRIFRGVSGISLLARREACPLDKRLSSVQSKGRSASWRTCQVSDRSLDGRKFGVSLAARRKETQLSVALDFAICGAFQWLPQAFPAVLAFTPHLQSFLILLAQAFVSVPDLPRISTSISSHCLDIRTLPADHGRTLFFRFRERSHHNFKV